CRRLQYLRWQRAERTAGDGGDHGVLGTATEAEGQRREERGGATVAAEVSGLLDDVAPGTEAANGGTKSPAVCGESAQSAASRSWTKSEPGDRGSEPAAAGMGLLLPAHRSEGRTGRTRQLAQTQAADAAVAAMETQLHASEESDAGRAPSCASLAVGHQRARSVVERRRFAHERSLSEV